MTKQTSAGRAGPSARRSGPAAAGRAQERPARLPAHGDAAGRLGRRRLRDGRRDPGRGAGRAGRGGRGRPGHGRDPARLHGGAGDGRPGAVRLGREVEPGAAHRRVSGLHRPRQHHPALPRRELGAVRRPQDLDLPPPPGREVEQRRRLHRRRRGVQLQALARPEDRLVEHRPVQRPGRGIRHRREGRRRQGQDGPAGAAGCRREGRRPHRPADLRQGDPVGAGEPLQLPDRDAASRFREERQGPLEGADRHRPLHAGRVRRRAEMHPQEDRAGPTGARTSTTPTCSGRSISTRSTISTTAPPRRRSSRRSPRGRSIRSTSSTSPPTPWRPRSPTR